ncbi:hypothetical protein GOODEAATRI_015689 [Goodea atripinnis]|uniref:Vomeronasal type-1 receptor n=1 Tax=Goodea atripinnis TaxID=208336 RepID=A0ABV0NUX1_9TELE
MLLIKYFCMIGCTVMCIQLSCLQVHRKKKRRTKNRRGDQISDMFIIFTYWLDVMLVFFFFLHVNASKSNTLMSQHDAWSQSLEACRLRHCFCFHMRTHVSPAHLNMSKHVLKPPGKMCYGLKKLNWNFLSTIPKDTPESGAPCHVSTRVNERQPRCS